MSDYYGYPPGSYMVSSTMPYYQYGHVAPSDFKHEDLKRLVKCSYCKSITERKSNQSCINCGANQ